MGLFGSGEWQRVITKDTKMGFDDLSNRVTYKKLSGAKIGQLINFNNSRLKDDIKRFVL